MEKNTLLAIVASIALIVLWDSVVMKRFAPPKPTEKTISEKVEKKNTATSIGHAVPKQHIGLPDLSSVNGHINKKVLAYIEQEQKNKKEKHITVDTELYTAVFSTRGGRLVSWKLKKQANSKGEMFEMISELSSINSDYPLGLSFKDETRSQIINEQIGSVDTEVELIALNESRPVRSITFSFLDPAGSKIQKTFTFHNETYLVDLDITQNSLVSENIDGGFYLKWSRGIHKDGDSKTSMTNTQISSWVDEELKQEKVGGIKDLVSLKGRVAWAAAENTYFAAFIAPPVPRTDIKMVREGDGDENVSFMVSGGTDVITAKGEAKDSFSLFIGPKNVKSLKAPGKGFEKILDYGWFGFLAKPLMDVIRVSSKYLGGYGQSIIVLTVLIKLVFYPLTQTSYRSMGAMQKLQPEIAKLKEKYKSDPKKLQQETMGLYKKYKVNPMGGCLPMVLQIPVFFALYKVLLIAIELRQAKFMWILDLSAPDPVSTILMGVSMLLQQITTPTAGDPKQQKMMLILPVIFTFMFWSFPAGLVLYWLVNNILTVVQQMHIKREKKEAAA